MEIKTITREELVNLQKEKKPKLIDVLDRKSYEKEHLPGALSIPLDELSGKAGELLPKKDELIITYCGGFDCPASTKAAKILLGQGYKNVLDYKGGLEDYKAGKLPVESGCHCQ